MMKKLILSLMFLLTFIPICQARIIVEADNLTDTITYRSYKHIGAFGITEYAFLKNINENNNANYYLRLFMNFPNHSSLASRYLTGKEVIVELDGKKFTAKKVINDYVPNSFQRFTPAMAFYKFDEQTISTMANANNISFTITIPQKDPTVIIVNEGNKEEIKTIISATFNDYLSDITNP